MTPQFKALLMFILLVCLFIATESRAEDNYKLCLADRLPDGSLGCWTTSSVVTYQEWLDKLDSKLVFVRAERVSKSIIRIYYK